MRGQLSRLLNRVDAKTCSAWVGHQGRPGVCAVGPVGDRKTESLPSLHLKRALCIPFLFIEIAKWFKFMIFADEYLETICLLRHEHAHAEAQTYLFRYY